MDRYKILSLLETGIELQTSGTTGERKSFFQTPKKLIAANIAAIDSQEINKDSRIYTVCKMQHAGGLLAQTLPALSIGATVDIEPFNPYSWVKKICNYTHSHIAPLHGSAIMNTKGFSELDLSGIWITCGSDPVSWELIRSFVGKGATFMANWGMTEIGPTAINKVFRTINDVDESMSRAIDGTILGDRFYCDYRILDGVLQVRGDISIFGSEWYDTRDLVSINDNGELYYNGRKNHT